MWWVFDKPVRSDMLFLVTLALALLAITAPFLEPNTYGSWVAFGLQILTNFVLTFVLTGTCLGVLREFIRGRRGA
jgi:4-amino-4-deoxy-L-arabinose transferase-like glycosyltransferase